ncbi:hypothetical protein POM88_036944 [Heracleum sosnowskyi]|uniref:Uncharacterized protein n=1 Tax=Heracleum sosnowskyi TaxID=360622 RepID=A0AAD8HP78_9APIA|nr:hypothetical protein POM88_036944 [Heracleum sosnowskyi]
MSAEELKIRRELEMDVEKELAAEIKDEICNLSLRLIQLYQQQKEREDRELSQMSKQIQLADPNNKALSEVNINIRMQGGTEVHITEADVRKTCPKPRISSKAETNAPKPSKLSEENTRRRIVSSRKKFDWVKTLRSGTSDVASHQQKLPKKTARMWDDNVQIAGIGTKCMVQRR